MLDGLVTCCRRCHHQCQRTVRRNADCYSCVLCGWGPLRYDSAELKRLSYVRNRGVGDP